MTILPDICLNYFVSKVILSKILKNLRGKKVLGVYFGRNDIIRPGNKLPKKIRR